MVGTTMNARDAITASLAECFVILNGSRYRLMQAINVEAQFTKQKTKVAILGRTGKGNKASGWEGTGTATFYYNTSLFRELAYRYQQTGEDFYFEMQITNEDPTSSVGRQTVILMGCNLDSTILAKFDADGELLDENIEFTFEGFEYPEKFKMLEGMM